MCEYVALRPNPNARPNGSIPATSSRSTHRNACTLRHPGPRDLPPRPLTPHHPPGPALVPRLPLSPGLSSFFPAVLPLPLPLLLSLSFSRSSVVSVDHFARPLIPHHRSLGGLDLTPPAPQML